MLLPDDVFTSSVAALAAVSPFTSAAFDGDGVIVASGSFDGAQVNKFGLGDRWAPLSPGRRFAYRRGQAIWLRQFGSVVGTISLEFYAGERGRHTELLEQLGRAFPGSPPAKLQLVTGWNVIIQAVAAADTGAGPVALSSNNVGSLATNRGNGVVYVGPTAAEATIAAGAQVLVGQALKVPFGKLFWAGDGVTASTLEIVEDLST